MSHGNGAFGETNAASGTSRPQYCCSPIRSLPSAPRPCSRITRRFGVPPATGGRDGPDRAISIGELAFLRNGNIRRRHSRCGWPLSCCYDPEVWTAADIQIELDTEL